MSSTPTAELKGLNLDEAKKPAAAAKWFEWHSKGGGVFWKDFEKASKKLGDMGITAAWLPPPTKASSQEGNGYDIYDLYDLGEFDAKGGKRTKWGTKEEYISCIKESKKNGIVIYVDAVLNHKAGADFTETFKVIDVDPDDRTKEISGEHDIDGWTGFNFPGRKGQHSKFEWNFNHFTGVDWDAKTEKKAIYKICGENKGWAQAVDKEGGKTDYVAVYQLMFADCDHSHPAVRDDMHAWGEWIVKETGIEGFRFDAIKHMDENFCAGFVNHVREKLNNEDMFCVGEFWKDSIESLTGYLDRFDTQFSIFDTPLHYNFKQASDQGDEFDIRSVWDGTLVKERPMDAVTLVDNHDTQPGESLESWIDPTFKPLGYALILFRADGSLDSPRPRYPCVFWGDLYGCNSEPHVEPMAQLDDFIRIRKIYTYGPTRDYWDHPNCAGWVREGDAEHEGCAVVICNGSGEGEKRMQLADGHAGEVWTDLLGWSQGEVTIGDDGWADFKCPAHSVSVWAQKDGKARDEFNNRVE
ncbi:alpha-amylase, partial [Phenoliferia sp. Uapishka_3]